MSQNLAEGFAGYRAAIYRNFPELPADQAREIQYAFNSGVLWILNEFLVLRDTNPDQLPIYHKGIMREIVDWFEAIHPGLGGTR